jgi:putative spermidine/putrescine transport system ATP-binding protein
VRVRAHKLSVDGISKTYGLFKALDGVSIQVAAGEFLTLLGPSGSGKTTLLMIIAGFTEPSAGEILIDDRPITHLVPEKRRFGMVFQGYALFPHLSVSENIAFPLRVQGTPRSEIEDRVRRAIDLVKLSQFADRMPKQLSGGQQQRVALARALVFSPLLLLLDEPLSALDKKLRAELQSELKDIHGRVGTTFVNVTHDQEEALSMSDRIAVLRDGRVVQQGTPVDLYDRPATRFVADFFGTTNFVSSKVAEAHVGKLSYYLGDKQFFHSDEDPPGKGSEILLSIRPDKISLRPAASCESPHLVGVIRSIQYLGNHLHLVVDANEFGLFKVDLPTSAAATAFERGSGVAMTWPEMSTMRVARD